MFKTAIATTLAIVIEATQLQTKTGELMINELDFAQFQEDQMLNLEFSQTASESGLSGTEQNS